MTRRLLPRKVDRHIFLEDGLGRTDFGGVDTRPGVVATLTPGEDEVLLAHRLIVSIQGRGIWGAHKFGNLAALSEGLWFEIFSLNEDRTVYTYNPAAIKTVGDFARYPFQVTYQDFGLVGGSKFFQADWEAQWHQVGVWLAGQDELGLRFQVVMADDFTGLDSLTFMVQATAHQGVLPGNEVLVS
jgi:hypothetical protein